MDYCAELTRDTYHSLLEVVGVSPEAALTEFEQKLKTFNFVESLNETARDMKFWFDVHFPNKDSVYEGTPSKTNLRG